MIAEKKEKYQQVLHVAKQLCGKDPDWVTFFREVLGIEGIVRKAFPNFDDLVDFEKSEEFAAIQRILVKLREKKPTAETETEPTRVITVRLPKSMHEYLRTEAHDLRTSMNKLCISKLLQMVEQEMIPAEKTATSRRRRKPAPTMPVGETLASRFAASNGIVSNGIAPAAPAAPTPSPLSTSPLSSSSLKSSF